MSYFHFLHLKFIETFLKEVKELKVIILVYIYYLKFSLQPKEGYSSEVLAVGQTGSPYYVKSEWWVVSVKYC